MTCRHALAPLAPPPPPPQQQPEGEAEAPPFSLYHEEAFIQGEDPCFSLVQTEGGVRVSEGGAVDAAPCAYASADGAGAGFFILKVCAMHGVLSACRAPPETSGSGGGGDDGETGGGEEGEGEGEGGGGAGGGAGGGVSGGGATTDVAERLAQSLERQLELLTRRAVRPAVVQVWP